MDDQAIDVYDVIIIGAGISGINTAHHLQSRLSTLSYTILESRSNIGGTWDLFRFPGIRSDTDLHTFGFSWNPWIENRAVADGDSIARYMSRAAVKEGIHHHIKFQHRVITANWSSKSQSWELIVETEGGARVKFEGRFLVLGTGYYDYHEPIKPQIPGLHENFKGKVLHPQFWPEDYDYTDKRIVIIGSGATAITLLPNMAKKAGHVTMLQRSPSYIMSLDNATGGSFIHKLLPKSWSFKLSRLMFMWMNVMLYYLCRAFPKQARETLQRKVAEQLPEHIPIDPHFCPQYRPWDQRLCFTPNGDFFECLRDGIASVETGHIKTITENAIILETGQHVEADIIVTATGLRVGIGGSIQFGIDGTHIDLTDRYAWRAAMLQDIPNLAFIIGYVNASWTLGAETTAETICRVLKHMQRNNLSSATPRVPDSSSIQPIRMWNLHSTYIKEAEKKLPRCGDSGPWKRRTNYFLDLWRAKYGDITADMEFCQGLR
ncbi:FAD/NAD(P)-binding domain-containing protein [Cadophora sp. DSE1049]|nr:FAD/NAD(P)-binding domain-containing protein [Cadophora sp. DSE1049]